MKKLLLALTFSVLFASVTFAAGSEGINAVDQSLNVRSTPMITNNIIGYFSKGQQVRVVKVLDRWCQVEYKNSTNAYVACEFLSPVAQDQNDQSQNAAESTPPTTIPAVVPVAENTCDTPIQEFGGINVKQDEMKTIPINACAKRRYLACLQNPTGNPDLYGGSIAPTTISFEQTSTDDFISNGEGNQSPRPDCISFEPTKNGDYYLGVYGAASHSTTNIWVSSSKLKNIPSGFRKSLIWFSDSCFNLTTEKYGPYNTAWGNDGDPDRPFYEGYPNYIHGGVDIACPANTPVKAMCDGKIVDSNDAGADWGWHTVLECKRNGHTISIAYIHLNQESVLPIGTPVTAGQVIGTVFDLNVPGELEHIHLTGCKKNHAACEAAGFHPERGAARRTEWWGVSHFWFDMDFHTNPGLYKALPSL